MVVQGNCLRAKGGVMVQSTQAATGGAFDWKWFLLSIEGRIPRSTYWLRFIPTAIALGFVSVFVDMALGTFNAEQGYGVISGLFSLAAIWPSIATGVKRLHDRNQTGWLYLILLIPFIGGLFWLINMGILKGTTGANKYGPDPLGGTN